MMRTTVILAAFVFAACGTTEPETVPETGPVEIVVVADLATATDLDPQELKIWGWVRDGAGDEVDVSLDRIIDDPTETLALSVGTFSVTGVGEFMGFWAVCESGTVNGADLEATLRPNDRVVIEVTDILWGSAATGTADSPPVDCWGEVIE